MDNTFREFQIVPLFVREKRNKSSDKREYSICVMEPGSYWSWFQETLCGFQTKLRTTVLDKINHRSHEVETSEGTYQRNCWDVVSSPEQLTQQWAYLQIRTCMEWTETSSYKSSQTTRPPSWTHVTDFRMDVFVQYYVHCYYLCMHWCMRTSLCGYINVHVVVTICVCELYRDWFKTNGSVIICPNPLL